MDAVIGYMVMLMLCKDAHDITSCRPYFIQAPYATKALCEEQAVIESRYFEEQGYHAPWVCLSVKPVQGKDA